MNLWIYDTINKIKTLFVPNLSFCMVSIFNFKIKFFFSFLNFMNFFKVQMVKFGHVKTNLNMVSLKPNVQHINKDICLLRFMVSLHSGSNGTKMLQNGAKCCTYIGFLRFLTNFDDFFCVKLDHPFCIFLIQNYLLWFELFKITYYFNYFLKLFPPQV